MRIKTKFLHQEVIERFAQTMYHVALHSSTGYIEENGAFRVSGLRCAGIIDIIKFDNGNMRLFTHSEELIMNVIKRREGYEIAIKENYVPAALSFITNGSAYLYAPKKVGQYGWGMVTEDNEIEYCTGDIAIHTNGEIECAEQPIRKLDHTGNRRMLAKLKALLDQVKIKAKLGIFTPEFLKQEGARIYGTTSTSFPDDDGRKSLDNFMKCGYNEVKDAVAAELAKICLRFLDTEELDPDDSVRIAMLMVKRAGTFYYLFHYPDRFSRMFQESLIRDLNNALNDAKEPLRIATGIVTFE